MKDETIDRRQFKKVLREKFDEGKPQANAYFKSVLLNAIGIAGGDFSAELPKHIANIGTEVLGEPQANIVIAECAVVLARQVEQSSF